MCALRFFRKEAIFANGRYGIRQKTVICTNCSLVFSSPRLDQESTVRFYSSDTYRIIYNDVDFLVRNDQKYKVAESYEYEPLNLEKYRLFSFLDFLYEAEIEFDSVCEVGAGGGANLIPFIHQGKQATGCDYSRALVLQGKKRGINLIQGSEVCRSLEIFNRFKASRYPHNLLQALHIYKPVRRVKRFIMRDPRWRKDIE